MKYVIVKFYDHDRLEAEVQKHVDRGHALVGGITCSWNGFSVCYMQAVLVPVEEVAL